MKPTVRTATVLAAVALALSGCGPSRNDPNRLTIWEQMDPAEQKLLRQHLDRFEEEHPGLRVDAVHFETENLRSNFQTAALAGTGPDLIYGPSDGVGPYSIMGLIWPLDAPELGIRPIPSTSTSTMRSRRSTTVSTVSPIRSATTSRWCATPRSCPRRPPTPTR